jgi:ribosome-binding protein aMBF1 (putative translation factor)
VSIKDWVTKDEFLADYSADPEAQARREKTALARAVARAVVRYRSDHGLSQSVLAAKLGIRQPHIARLELGERHPTIETLEKLSRVLGLRFILDVAPAGAERAALPKGMETVEEITTPAGARVLIAAG